MEIRSLIRRLSQVSTILFSTHILSEVEALCDRAIILINGQVRSDARLSELSSSSDAVLVLDRDSSGVVKQLKALDGVTAVEKETGTDGYPASVCAGPGGVGTDLCPLITSWRGRTIGRCVNCSMMPGHLKLFLMI